MVRPLLFNFFLEIKFLIQGSLRQFFYINRVSIRGDILKKNNVLLKLTVHIVWIYF